MHTPTHNSTNFNVEHIDSTHIQTYVLLLAQAFTRTVSVVTDISGLKCNIKIGCLVCSDVFTTDEARGTSNETSQKGKNLGFMTGVLGTIN